MTHTRKLALLFVTLIALGTALLSLPGMSAAGRMPLLDALFMATSAVCVTGLMTMDLGSQLTVWADVVILVLIQLGGIGIATMASLVILTGRRLSIGYEDMLSSTVAVAKTLSVSGLTITVVRFTLAIELLGALLLLPFWPSGAGWGERIWWSLFHSISAFCNAGFSLFSTNLEAFTDNWGVNIVIMVLIVPGGFGFMNLFELVRHWRGGTFRWSMFTLFLKAAIVFTAILIAFGAVVLFAVEYGGAMADLPLAEKLLASLFHSVTTRTAGFNTIPIAEFTSFSLLIMMMLMFVGGNSGSCAGGIKVSTLAVIFSIFRSYVRHDRDPLLFARRLPAISQRRAFVLTATSVVFIVVGVGLVDLLDYGFGSFENSGNVFAAYVFETVSAAGTVGLSTGITPTLTPGSKIVVIVLMFVGRLGPLAAIEAWSARPSLPHQFTNPEEGLPVG